MLDGNLGLAGPQVKPSASCPADCVAWVEIKGAINEGNGYIDVSLEVAENVGRTGAHLWADRFDATLEDIFELQDNVASSVAGVIEPTLKAAEHRRSTQRPTNDLTAYDLYLQAHALSQSWAREATMRALDLLGRALNRDARYGLALAQAAFLHTSLDANCWSEDQQRNRQNALDLARRALQASGDNPDVLGNALITILASPKGNQGSWEVGAGALKISARPVLSLRSPSGEHKVRTSTLTQVAIIRPCIARDGDV